MRFMTAVAAFSLAAAATLPAFAADKPVNSPTPANPNTAVTAVAPEPDLKTMEHTAHSKLITDAPLSTDFVLGKRTAPLVMIEYASLSCPHCAHFSETTLPELTKKYIDTGKMMYIMRAFPLNAPALKAADLLQCVGQQDSNRYYTFAKVLFESQGKWAYEANYMADLQTIAEVGGVSKAQFEQCVNNTDIETKVLTIKKEANDELKVPHTPYIFIGGHVYDGSRDIASISHFIDAQLAKLKEGKK